MKSWQFYLLLMIALILAACSQVPQPILQGTSVVVKETSLPTVSDSATPDSPTASPIPTQPVTPLSEQPANTPDLALTPILWAAEYIPGEIITQTLAQLEWETALTTDQKTATMLLDVDSQGSAAQWVYVLAAPFPTISDGVTWLELQEAWKGELVNGPFEGVSLLTDGDTYQIFSSLWGTPSPGAVQVVHSKDLLRTAWANQPSWAIVPFNNLEPRWKVLEIDGLSPIQKAFDPEIYPLTANFSLLGDAPPIKPISNYDPKKMTDLILSGVTALVRGTALTMERKGITYPGEDIAPITTQVDFMHVNNEIPFTPDCPFPELYPEKLVFCSDLRYLELLEYIGTDFVEVSGDHFGDHGPEGTLFTLDLYDESELPYYGGGRDLEDGRKALLVEHNGNRIAILGCNAKGNDYYAPADADTPGAVPCDFDWMEGEIARLIDEGHLVIVTLQHIEYYSYEAQPDLVRDFARMAAAGASIVSGSQSHQAHGMALPDQAFIHYGLGNLFFDQYLYCENAVCDYGFMDRHVVYDGQHISTELIPIRFIDMARPRLMTPEEKAWFLDLIFEASGW